MSFATVYWIDVFTKQLYFNVLTESICFCREQKGMKLYAYCFMSNHMHFIFRSNNNQPTETIKRYTSNKVIEAIENNLQESRKYWLL